MEIASLYLMLSTLNIHPSITQFFWYDSVILTCDVGGTSAGWIVKRNTTSQTSEPCSSGWGLPRESSCIIEDAYPSDSGVYWCESERGKSSNTVNITITDSDVILESPARPVTEGETVTLVCSHKEENHKKSTSDFSTKFYKDGVFIGTQPTGSMTFSAISLSDAGFYKCEHPTKGESPQSWLAVRAHGVTAEPPSDMFLPKLACGILLIVLYSVMLIFCVNVYRNWADQRSKSGDQKC